MTVCKTYLQMLTTFLIISLT